MTDKSKHTEKSSELKVLIERADQYFSRAEHQGVKGFGILYYDKAENDYMKLFWDTSLPKEERQNYLNKAIECKNKSEELSHQKSHSSDKPYVTKHQDLVDVFSKTAIQKMRRKKQTY